MTCQCNYLLYAALAEQLPATLQEKNFFLLTRRGDVCLRLHVDTPVALCQRLTLTTPVSPAVCRGALSCSVVDAEDSC